MIQINKTAGILLLHPGREKNCVHLQNKIFAFELLTAPLRKTAHFPLLIKQKDIRSSNSHSVAEFFSFLLFSFLLSSFLFLPFVQKLVHLNKLNYGQGIDVIKFFNQRRRYSVFPFTLISLLFVINEWRLRFCEIVIRKTRGISRD